jgi:ribA/ribD-fused uncharacterized protein
MKNHQELENKEKLKETEADDENQPIYFYGSREGTYACFSNFSHHPIDLDNKRWGTTEHYFQAQKFPGTPQADKIRKAPSPKEAARMGRDRAFPLRPDWEKVKDDIMRRAVLKKFETHADAREVLLSTGDRKIIENAPNDYYWGCGSDGSGKNMLGKILMETRKILRQREEKKEDASR